MNYNKFTKEAFESLSGNKQLTTALLQELDSEVTNELHEYIAIKMQEIVNKLNSHGHNLKRDKSIEYIGATDFCETPDSENCGFGIGSNIIISSEYYGKFDIIGDE